MTSPNSLEPSTTVISPYLTSGCISMRQVFYAIDECIRKHKGQATSPPTSLVGQLFFREMWYGNAYFHPNHDISKAKDNPIARDIPWYVYIFMWFIYYHISRIYLYLYL